MFAAIPDAHPLSSYFESIGYGIAALDRDLRYRYANAAALTMVGMTAEFVIGRTPYDIFPAPLNEAVASRLREALETGRPVEYEVHHASAGRWYENRLFPSAGGVTVFFSDITDRKAAEQALRSSEASQRQMAAAMRESRDVLSLAMRGGRMGAWSRNLLTEEVWWSRELEEIFGLEPGGFAGTRGGFLAFVHEDDRPRLDEAVSKAIESRADYVVEFRFRRASGEWGWMEGRGAFTYGPAGEPSSLYGVGIDITARTEASRAIADARAAAAADAAHLNIALSAARLGDWRWDAATDLVTMSSSGAQIFGIPPGPHMTWTDMRALLHPEDRERARLAVEQAVAAHSDYLIDYRLINQGRERWITASGRAIYDENGTPTGMFGVVHDITHDRMLVRLDDAVRGLVSADDITFTSATLLGNHLNVNRCAYAVVEDDQDSFVLTGNYTRETHSAVGRYRFSQFGEACLRMMRAGEPFVVEDSRTDPRVDESVKPAYEAMTIGAVICVSIRKNQRFVAAMAVHMNEPRRWDADEVELVQQVASRCWESLERARVERERVGLLQAAQAANRVKDEFMAMLGHELRNPLSPIVTALQLMRLRGDATTQRERQVIERQVTHLTRLVDDLLDVSRIARGKVDLKIEVVDLAEVIARAVETASPLLEQRMHTLHVGIRRGAALVHGDGARLTQVFSNLLTNAAKYTPQGGQIDVGAQVGARDVVVTVTDTGVGIGPEMLPHVFDAFAQGQQHLDRAQGGLGLGLTIVHSLVERHGGEVWVASDGPGRGTTFSVRLPLSSEQRVAPTPLPDVIAARSGEGTRVLIVDDNVDAAAMLATALTLKGFTVEIAHDGLEALRGAARFLPHFAVLDIGLPVMDGYELADRLRKTPGLGELRLIAVTGYGQASDRDRSAASGFDDHLVKPVDAMKLMRLMIGRREG